ncbi:circularly permuted type 2 ATP-grasp protein [Methylocystis bryophila]|uniref:Uncharacterized protein n=1 Tax=Methylocystis bryophila TaxID=655015 RepID=A0A1W6MR15_9HYPH|nr:circularly permuted type 2 ATP-grasp protein [Methylocystis bryophila]ARN80050.1 hypothetical protein B1812_01970 [Methylocystis bryophila]BDV39966.1 hypothetical protein DSM21852_32190 [Methylocystis bryophila]
MAVEQSAWRDDDSVPVSAWLAGYSPLAGTHDELIGPDGRPRAHWLTFFDSLSALGENELEHRFAAAGRRIRDYGVTYRVHGEARERPWPLSRLPLLITESDWRGLAAGVTQRATLLERFLRDVYGEARLVAEGALPAAALAGSPNYIRPMHGVAPQGGRWLGFYAVDVTRGADGSWRVLGDRAQAPSGAGYAIENRLILARTFPSLYREMNVRRVGPFFRDFRVGLAATAQRSAPRICLMTPGPYSETYSEQALLARHLGFLLVEGADLIVNENRLHVRTIAGQKRVDVVWRRIDADWCDPLEMNAASRLGVPGLFDAIRQGAVAVTNMPGAGLVESRAVFSFLPALAPKLLGEELRLPQTGAWWCGDPRAREDILARLDALAITGAHGEKAPGFAKDGATIGAALDSSGRERLAAALEARGMDYVGQEIGKFSTTPSFVDGALAPRPFVLRVFAAATSDGWSVMPGGFCRVSDDPNMQAVSMGAGASSADVWVLAERRVEETSLVASLRDDRIIRVLGNLPSRAADNLFWMGRYLERAEATLRLVRALCHRLTDEWSDRRWVVERLKRMLLAWGAVSELSEQSAAAITVAATSDPSAYGSALSIAGQIRAAASIVRDRISPEVWQLVARLEMRLERAAKLTDSEPEMLENVQLALYALAALSGYMSENFNRVAGWDFLDLGKRIERAIVTCRFARQFADAEANDDSLDALLELIDSQITYRSRYLGEVSRVRTLDMVMLDPFNPRSVGFQLAQIDAHLAALPTLHSDGMPEAPRRLALKLRAEIEVEDARRVDAQRVLEFEQSIMLLADALADRYFVQATADAPKDEPSGLA